MARVGNIDGGAGARARQYWIAVVAQDAAAAGAAEGYLQLGSGKAGPLERMLNAEQGRLGNHGLDGGLDFFPSEADVLDALQSGAGESRVLLGYRYAGVQQGQRIVADATAGGGGRPMHWIMDEIADQGIDSAVLHNAQNVRARLTLMADDEVVWSAVVRSTKSLDTTGPDAGLGFTQILEVLVP